MKAWSKALPKSPFKWCESWSSALQEIFLFWLFSSISTNCMLGLGFQCCEDLWLHTNFSLGWLTPGSRWAERLAVMLTAFISLCLICSNVEPGNDTLLHCLRIQSNVSWTCERNTGCLLFVIFFLSAVSHCKLMLTSTFGKPELTKSWKL